MGAVDGVASVVRRGEYLARAGDCIACHTSKGGKPFAGGLPFETPIGTIYSTNITPDKDTGIGDYSYEDFDRAVRYGIARKGYTLYPVMPYPSYARVSPDDIKALYAYFMHGVAPVHRPTPESGVPWPLSMRWPLALWRRAFEPAVAAPTVAGDAAGSNNATVLARGRYLVEGLGHCGACHTSRGVFLQERALSDDKGPAFLGGGLVEQWFANDLRSDRLQGLGGWTRAEIVAFLKTGRNEHSAAFGGMQEVIVDSTQYLSDGDLDAVVAYLQSLSPVKPGVAPPTYDDAAAKALHAGRADVPGAQSFLDNCAACHRSDGRGYAGVFPRLALSATVSEPDPTSLIHIVLRGSAMPGTAGAPTSFAMPGFAERLTDQQVADVLCFIRSSWGNRARSVSGGQVRAIRNATR
nr:cytochrome c [Burkholderia sp. LMG 13014]